ncbi:hypothetical protein DB347_21245 [Opitutaceae bacterium EW11]|nr:hypothetical protein DB347_21245 [Opitutaceae bacterium EW11]
MNSFRSFARRFAVCAIVGSLLFAAGCLEKRVVWSPDGARAAVVGGDGLYLCDANGHLSALQVPGVRAAAWAGDSQHLVLAKRRETSRWQELAGALGADQPVVEQKAERLWSAFQADPKWDTLKREGEGSGNAVALCLLERHGEELRSKLTPDDWKELQQDSVDLYEILTAHIEGDRVIADRTRHVGAGTLIDLRPSPDGAALAFTAEDVTPKTTALRLLALKGSAAPVAVASQTSGYPDWTYDGLSLAYIQAQPSTAKDAVELAVLARRQVLDRDGRIAVAEKPEELAGLLFNPLTHVRCLKDGRILFNAAEVSLPLAAADFNNEPREQLFVADPSRQATLSRLVPRRAEPEIPQSLSFFEVSPDGTQVVFGGLKGEVAVLTLATGDARLIQTASDKQYHGVPMWRVPGEFSYVKRVATSADKTPERRMEIVLRNGDVEKTLSASWSAEMLDGVAQRSN